MHKFIDLEIIDNFCVDSIYRKCFNTSYILEIEKENNNRSSIKLSYTSIRYIINMKYEDLIKLINK